PTAHRIRQAVRLVGPRPPRRRVDAPGGPALRGPPRLLVLLREPRGPGDDDRRRREERGHGVGRRDPRPRDRVALPLEDGAPPRRHARGGRPRERRCRRDREIPPREVERSREVDRAAVGALPRERPLLKEVPWRPRTTPGSPRRTRASPPSGAAP